MVFFLFVSQFGSGRPLFVRQLRRGESTKLTLAQAAGDVQAVNGGDAEDLCHFPPGVSNRVARTKATTQEENARQNDNGNSSTGRVTSQASQSPSADGGTTARLGLRLGRLRLPARAEDRRGAAGGRRGERPATARG